MAARSASEPLRVLRTRDEGFAKVWTKIRQRREDSVEDVSEAAAAIIARVRRGGDSELRACI